MDISIIQFNIKMHTLSHQKELDDSYINNDNNGVCLLKGNFFCDKSNSFTMWLIRRTILIILKHE